MIYDLNNILDKERFKRRSNDLYKKKAVVELTEKKRKRTLSQNSYLHYLLGYYAMETGNTIEYVKREYFKKLCNPSLFLIPKHDKYIGDVYGLGIGVHPNAGYTFHPPMKKHSCKALKWSLKDTRIIYE